MFDNILGNEKIKNYLINAIKLNSISHSYMFVGKSGIGKKLFAKEFAKKVMCLGSNNCESCLKFDLNSNPDFTIIEPEGKSIKIEQIRNLQSKIFEKPIISKKKVYIIDNAELMTEESQNCLLKTLEEPPEYAMIILIVSNESRLLQTILSRVIKLKFEDLSNNDIKNFINNNDIEIIKLCDGSLENIEKIKDNKENYDKIKVISDALSSNTLLEVLNVSEVLYSLKENIIEMLDYLNIIFFDKAKKDIKYTNIINIIEKTKKKIIANNNYDMCIDYMILHIWEELHGKSNRS